MVRRTTFAVICACATALAVTASPAVAQSSRSTRPVVLDGVRDPADAYAIADGGITPIRDDFAEPEIPDNHGAFAAAVTPNGKYLLVVNQENDTVLPIRRPADVRMTPIHVGDNPVAIVVTPNSKWAFVANNHSPTSHTPYTVTPINLSTMHAGTPIKTHGVNPFDLVVTPNGRWVFVGNTDSDTVTPVRVSTRKAHRPIRVGYNPEAMVVGPHGKTVWVLDNLSNEVTPINVATRHAGRPIKVGKMPTGLALTPNGKLLLVANNRSGTVSVINAATRHRLASIHVGKYPNQVAVSPSGTTAYVTNWNGSPHSHNDKITPITLSTLTAGAAITVGRQPAGLTFVSGGALLMVPCLAHDKVWVINPATNATESPITTDNFPGYVAAVPS